MLAQTIIVIACPTVIEELRPLLPEGVETRILDFGLHITPDKLRQRLQNEIDAMDGKVDTIILGYGLCSNAVTGLRTTHSILVIPRVDDCISIFLGSRRAYREQSRQEPGTYYLTKGWIEVGDSPFDEHARLVGRYGRERADRVMELMLKHYTRLAYINTGQTNQERYRHQARQTAEKFKLRFEEIPGSLELIRKMIYGPWDDDFIVASPGHVISFEDFQQEGLRWGDAKY
jgi:hypothetical protein